MKFHVEIRLLDDFSIVDFQQGDSRQYVYDKTLTIFLEEKAIIPDESISYGYKCSGFMEPSLINDCPFRSMLVTLSIKCRPWNVKKGGQIRNEIKSELSIPGT